MNPQYITLTAGSKGEMEIFLSENNHDAVVYLWFPDRQNAAGAFTCGWCYERNMQSRPNLLCESAWLIRHQTVPVIEALLWPISLCSIAPGAGFYREVQ